MGVHDFCDGRPVFCNGVTFSAHRAFACSAVYLVEIVLLNVTQLHTCVSQSPVYKVQTAGGTVIFSTGYSSRTPWKQACGVICKKYHGGSLVRNIISKQQRDATNTNWCFVCFTQQCDNLHWRRVISLASFLFRIEMT